MNMGNNNHIYDDNKISVYSVNTESVPDKYWEAIENSYKKWFYESFDQRYLDGGVHAKMNRKLLSFYLRLKNSYLLIAIKNKKIVGFSELYFGKTPIQYINQRKFALRFLGKICFSHITMTMPDFRRSGVSLVLEKAKESLCKKLNAQIIISLICIKPIPNLASLNRAKKLRAYFTGLSFTTQRNDGLLSNVTDVEYTEVLNPVDKTKKISMYKNTLVITPP